MSNEMTQTAAVVEGCRAISGGQRLDYCLATIETLQTVADLERSLQELCDVYGLAHAVSTSRAQRFKASTILSLLQPIQRMDQNLLGPRLFHGRSSHQCRSCE